MKRRNRKSNKKKRLFVFMMIIIILIVLVIGIFSFRNRNKDKDKLSVVLKDNLEVEVNSEVYLLSFVDDVINGSIVSEDELIDTSKLGDKEIVLSVMGLDDIISEYKFKILVKDTIKPVIEAEDEVIVYVGEDVDLTKNVKVTDNSLENIKVEVVGEYRTDVAGKYNLTYVASDSSGNELKYDFILNVVIDSNNRTFTTSNGYSGKVVDGVTYIDGVLIVNKSYSLPSNYGNGLTSETTYAFNKMKNDASNLGLNIYISSGYRSYYDQQSIYNGYVNRDGKASADTYSARAGYSEHQSGLSFDLNSIDSSFANTDEGKWVNDNCYKYGFIIRFPNGKDSSTGYMYESWHLRYVGVDLATKLYNDGQWISLEEYYGIDSKY